ncbi:hypothetical protein, partial [Campylobacter geochelonis]|uniref:hypothetical protein n=1 Tax=Campylobacter geochelonis TaxID=1780362 RepID=UPI000AFDDDC8
MKLNLANTRPCLYGCANGTKKLITISVIVSSLLLPLAAAVNITWDNDSDKSLLMRLDGWDDSLGQGDITKNLEGNIIAVNSDPGKNDINGAVFGGYYKAGDDKIVRNNVVKIMNGNIGKDVRGGNSTWGLVESNRVEVFGGHIGNNVNGGTSVEGNVQGNIVNIYGGTIKRIVSGGSTNKISDSNEVNIFGGTIGDKDNNGRVYGGYSQVGSSTKNAVTISGGTVNGDIVGGYIVSSSAGKATSNTVTIKGNPNLANSTIYGGYNGYYS